MAQHIEDDGFHEIQLNGKQLVFLFMAATVVSVVIFLSGVLVGRGVRAERSSAEIAATPADPTAPIAAPAAAGAPPAAAAEDPTTAPPPSPPAESDNSRLTYPDRLTGNKPPKEQLPHPSASADGPRAVAQSAPPAPKPGPAAAKSAPPSKPAPAQLTAPVTPPPAAAPAASSSGDAGVFTVQIAALNARGEADAIAHRLTTKGYAAYVVPPGNGAVMYRVRVGKFKTRREAEPIASKLQKEEQFRPWITR